MFEYSKSESKEKWLRNRDKKQRFQIFAEWIVATYGHDYLTQGGGIIDVVGGKGRMAMEPALHNNLLRLQLVDPNIAVVSQ